VPKDCQNKKKKRKNGARPPRLRCLPRKI